MVPLEKVKLINDFSGGGGVDLWFLWRRGSGSKVSLAGPEGRAL